MIQYNFEEGFENTRQFQMECGDNFFMGVLLSSDISCLALFLKRMTNHRLILRILSNKMLFFSLKFTSCNQLEIWGRISNQDSTENVYWEFLQVMVWQIVCDRKSFKKFEKQNCSNNFTPWLKTYFNRLFSILDIGAIWADCIGQVKQMENLVEKYDWLYGWKFTWVQFETRWVKCFDGGDRHFCAIYIPSTHLFVAGRTLWPCFKAVLLTLTSIFKLSKNTPTIFIRFEHSLFALWSSKDSKCGKLCNVKSIEKVLYGQLSYLQELWNTTAHTCFQVLLFRCCREQILKLRNLPT